MKKALLGVAILAVIACRDEGAVRFSRVRLDARVANFHSDSENLALALQQYKEFAGDYPHWQ